MSRKRKNLAAKTIPEAEELRALNRKIQENRDRHTAEQLLDNYRRLFVAVCQCMRERAAVAQAEEKHLRKRKRMYHNQMRTLARRILLCVAVMLGVCLSWWFNLVRVEFFLGVLYLCSCIIAFACGSGWEKGKQFGGETDDLKTTGSCSTRLRDSQVPYRG